MIALSIGPWAAYTFLPQVSCKESSYYSYKPRDQQIRYLFQLWEEKRPPSTTFPADLATHSNELRDFIYPTVGGALNSMFLKVFKNIIACNNYIIEPDHQSGVYLPWWQHSVIATHAVYCWESTRRKLTMIALSIGPWATFLPQVSCKESIATSPGTNRQYV